MGLYPLLISLFATCILSRDYKDIRNKVQAFKENLSLINQELDPLRDFQVDINYQGSLKKYKALNLLLSSIPKSADLLRHGWGEGHTVAWFRLLVKVRQVVDGCAENSTALLGADDRNLLYFIGKNLIPPLLSLTDASSMNDIFELMKVSKVVLLKRVCDETQQDCLAIADQINAGQHQVNYDETLFFSSLEKVSSLIGRLQTEGQIRLNRIQLITLDLFLSGIVLPGCNPIHTLSQTGFNDEQWFIWLEAVKNVRILWRVLSGGGEEPMDPSQVRVIGHLLTQLGGCANRPLQDQYGASKLTLRELVDQLCQNYGNSLKSICYQERLKPTEVNLGQGFVPSSLPKFIQDDKIHVESPMDMEMHDISLEKDYPKHAEDDLSQEMEDITMTVAYEDTQTATLDIQSTPHNQASVQQIMNNWAGMRNLILSLASQLDMKIQLSNGLYEALIDISKSKDFSILLALVTFSDSMMLEAFKNPLIGEELRCLSQYLFIQSLMLLGRGTETQNLSLITGADGNRYLRIVLSQWSIEMLSAFFKTFEIYSRGVDINLQNSFFSHITNNELWYMNVLSACRVPGGMDHISTMNSVVEAQIRMQKEVDARQAKSLYEESLKKAQELQRRIAASIQEIANIYQNFSDRPQVNLGFMAPENALLLIRLFLSIDEMEGQPDSIILGTIAAAGLLSNIKGPALAAQGNRLINQDVLIPNATLRIVLLCLGKVADSILNENPLEFYTLMSVANINDVDPVTKISKLTGIPRETMFNILNIIFDTEMSPIYIRNGQLDPHEFLNRYQSIQGVPAQQPTMPQIIQVFITNYYFFYNQNQISQDTSGQSEYDPMDIDWEAATDPRYMYQEAPEEIDDIRVDKVIEAQELNPLPVSASNNSNTQTSALLDVVMTPLIQTTAEDDVKEVSVVPLILSATRGQHVLRRLKEKKQREGGFAIKFSDNVINSLQSTEVTEIINVLDLPKVNETVIIEQETTDLVKLVLEEGIREKLSLMVKMFETIKDGGCQVSITRVTLRLLFTLLENHPELAQNRHVGILNYQIAFQTVLEMNSIDQEYDSTLNVTFTFNFSKESCHALRQLLKAALARNIVKEKPTVMTGAILPEIHNIKVVDINDDREVRAEINAFKEIL